MHFRPEAAKFRTKLLCHSKHIEVFVVGTFFIAALCRLYCSRAV